MEQATCPDCGHLGTAHYAIKPADPQGRAECGEHLGCEACDDPDSAITFVLYGVAARDPDERVCGFFQTRRDASEFAKDLPGSYDLLVVAGIDFDAIQVNLVVHPFREGES